MTSSFSNKNLVIASVQTETQVVPTFQTSDSIPNTRPNGGDLQAGDSWYDNIEQVFHVHDGSGWIPVGGPAFMADILDRLTRLEQNENPSA